jgi:hypothetical protein
LRWTSSSTSDPVAGFQAGYIDAGVLVVALGLVAAILINPQADLRRFDRSRTLT